VDPETLDVFFSLEQTSVLGTNLIRSLCGEQDVETREQPAQFAERERYKVADFEAYYPSLGEPKAFVATPVFDGPRMIAIMVLKLPIEPISSALSGNQQWQAEGLGKSGEVYLVGPDHTMRNDSRFLIEDRAAFLATLRRSGLTSRTVDTVEKLGTTILVVPVEDDAARAALRGESGLMAISGYRGIPALMAYGPVDLDSLRWGVVAKIDVAEAMAPLGEYARRVLAWGVGLSLLATVMALLLARLLTRPITALVRAANRVSQGALDVTVEVTATDEYRELGEAFNNMVTSLRTNRQELDRRCSRTSGSLVSLPPASGAAIYATGTRKRDGPSQTSRSRINLVDSSRSHRGSARTGRWPSSAMSWPRATRPPPSTRASKKSAPSALRIWLCRDCRWNVPTTPPAWSNSRGRSCIVKASTPSAACDSSRRLASAPDRWSAVSSAAASSSTTCGATR
jgi:HAMP domain-containing protein